MMNGRRHVERHHPPALHLCSTKHLLLPNCQCRVYTFTSETNHPSHDVPPERRFHLRSGVKLMLSRVRSAAGAASVCLQCKLRLSADRPHAEYFFHV